MKEQLPPSSMGDLREISQEQKKDDIFKLIVFVYPAVLLLLIVLTFAAFVATA